MGLPMQIAETGAGYAICDYQGGRRRIDTMLVGDLPAGTWLLVFIVAAREVTSAENAHKINNAQSALDAVMAGNPADTENLFADIIQNPASNRKDAN